MEKPSAFKIWMLQIRANFLLLAVILGALGTGLAMWIKGKENISYFEVALMTTGLILAHISVNLFNEHSDNQTKIDYNTKRTPFSGGTGMIQAQYTKPETVFKVAVITLLVALAIGIYFIINSHWLLIFIVFAGGAIVISYTTYLSEWLLGEIAAGLGLGTFVVLGAYLALATSWDTSFTDAIPLSVLAVSFPVGILTFQLLYLNEFPDMEADEKGGRYHLVIFLRRQKAAYLYGLLMLINSLFIALLAFLNIPSMWMLLALIPAPIAAAASIIAIKNPDDLQKLVPAQAMNIITVLATDALMAAAFFI